MTGRGPNSWNDDIQSCIDEYITHTNTVSFVFHGLSTWNSLPSTPRDSSLSLREFKGRLKTYLFGRDSWTIMKSIRRFLIVVPCNTHAHIQSTSLKDITSVNYTTYSIIFYLLRLCHQSLSYVNRGIDITETYCNSRHTRF